MYSAKTEIGIPPRRVRFPFHLSSIRNSPRVPAHCTRVLELGARDSIASLNVAISVEKYEHQQTMRLIYNGRPVERRGSLVMIYDGALARLKHELRNLSNLAEPPR